MREFLRISEQFEGSKIEEKDTPDALEGFCSKSLKEFLLFRFYGT